MPPEEQSLPTDDVPAEWRSMKKFSKLIEPRSPDVLTPLNNLSDTITLDPTEPPRSNQDTEKLPPAPLPLVDLPKLTPDSNPPIPYTKPSLKQRFLGKFRKNPPGA